MKTMKNGLSVLQTTMKVMASWDETDFNEFEKWTRKNKPRNGNPKGHKYEQLYRNVKSLIQNGEDFASYDDAPLRKWCTENSISTSFNDLCRELYEKILASMGRTFKAQEEQKWREEIMEGMYAVQALIEKRLYTEAGALIEKLEGKIPESYDRRFWFDTTFMFKMASLKVSLAGDVDFVEATEDDRFLDQFDRMRLMPNQNLYNTNSQPFRKYKDQAFLIKLFLESIDKQESAKKSEDAISKIIHGIPQRNQHLKNQNERFPFRNNTTPEEFFEKIYWNFFGFSMMMDAGLHDKAMHYINEIRNTFWSEYNDSAFSFAILAWLGQLLGEIDSQKPWDAQKARNEESEPGDIPNFSQALWQSTHEHIEFLPHRVEFNRILLLCGIKDIEKTHTLVAQMMQLTGIPKGLSIHLRLLQAWLWLEEGKRKDIENITRTYHFVRKQKGFDFERHTAAIFDKISSFDSGSWKEQIEKKAAKDLKAILEFKKILTPFHRFISDWLRTL
jgi:hypothetical protein